MQDFRKGGAGNSKNLRLIKTRMKIFQPKTKSVFLPKIRWRPKKKKKGLYSNLVRFLAEKKVFAHRFCAQTFCPSYKGGGGGGGACHNFAYFSMLIILSWKPKGEWNGPPKYAPESIIIHILFKYCFVVGFRFGFRFIFDFSTVPIWKKENKKRNYWLTEEESRTQGSRPRSRTKKFQGQGQERSRP